MTRKLRVPLSCYFALIVLAAACATTQVTSIVDPEFRGRSYGTLMVFVDFQDLALRQVAEGRFQANLTALGTETVRSIDLFFPGREYSLEQAQQIISDSGIEAVLVAASSDAGTTTAWIPALTTTRSAAAVTSDGAAATAASTTSGGYYLNRPWASFEAALHDMTTGEVVWLASMASRGNAFADWEDLTRSMVRETWIRLADDGVINLER